ncbi:hypothetical protein [Flavobacterium sp. HSC-61S13]|nr:hypothetical protein [Flavobacterium sp. HSC-61S13]
MANSTIYFKAYMHQKAYMPIRTYAYSPLHVSSKPMHLSAHAPMRVSAH